ncbi:NACHT domain-containing protein [Streptomyces hainanensis]|uniref:NACHT domain-containing protein n=1 Tax=Streptomyces hainanensis TaxID=402648 RepID=A0A4R4TP09_9ACTN|nr:NACHT domain-containing protein [Streptomyces hainanensis]TDC75829.1 NACHT domain-containing protein [Streptomyces hainanensis]
MELAGAGLRLASSAFTPLIRRLFRQDGPGAGLADKPVRISSLVSFRGEKRSVGQADLDRLCEKLLRRAVRGMGPHDAPAEEEIPATAGLLARTFAGLGDLDMDDVQAVRLGHQEFARRVAISDHGLYRRVLDAACLHILNFFTQRSTFVARTLVEQSRQLDRLSRAVDLLIERVPSRSAEDTAFEERYARYVQHEHGRLAIYGLDLRQSREWPLDDAYLSLETHAEPESVPRRAERALAGHERVLLRGLAGSGKTTLVQWLAVVAARQELHDGLSHLLGRVPFVLPMRTLTRDRQRLPEPDQFLAVVDCPLAGAQPERWMDRVLSAGRGLLLVDGIDEIPENERDAVRTWLRRLNASYPGNLWLVTARPSAVRQDWLGPEAFTELTLSPMNHADVQAFTRRWHLAVGAAPEAERALLDLIRSRPDLGALAASPLMCALICALHRERNGHLPRGRKALYDAALAMLLERRDRERPNPPRGGLELDAETQISLLQKLAYWLITNGRSELATPLATRLIGQALPAIHQGDRLGPPEDVLRRLVERSGVLREPAEGAMDFVHRTFQDYLGAREMVEWQHFPSLVEKAHLDQWEDVVRMAVAHAQPVQRGEILRALVERGDDDPEHRVRLHLLAMACLEHATQLSPDIRAEVVARAGNYLPPRNRGESVALSHIGSVAAELLPGPESLSDDEAEAVVFAARRIGSEAALSTLRAFRHHHSPAVRYQLALSWPRFDTEKYFREIITHLPTGEEQLFYVTSRVALRLLGTLRGVRTADLRGDYTGAEVIAALAPQPLHELHVRDWPSLDDAGLFQAFPGLRNLTLDECPGLTDLVPLAGTGIESLRLYSDTRQEPAGGLTALRALRELTLGQLIPLPSLDLLPPGTSLTTLGLPKELPDLTTADRWPELASLSMPFSDRSLSLPEWSTLRGLPALRSVVLTARTLRSLVACGMSLPNVTWVQLFDTPAPVTPTDEPSLDLMDIPDAFPGLRALRLTTTPTDYSPLARLPELTSLTFHGPIGTGHDIPDHIEVVAPSAPRY